MAASQSLRSHVLCPSQSHKSQTVSTQCMLGPSFVLRCVLGQQPRGASSNMAKLNLIICVTGVAGLEKRILHVVLPPHFQGAGCECMCFHQVYSTHYMHHAVIAKMENEK
jgi:hypothetical protein